MIDLVKKTMLAGIGVAVVTKDKVLESLDELVEKGKLSKDEAVAMSDKIVEEGRSETEKAKVEASKLFNEMGCREARDNDHRVETRSSTSMRQQT